MKTVSSRSSNADSRIFVEIRDEEKTGAKILFHSIRDLMALVGNQSRDIAAMMAISTTRIIKFTALIIFFYQRIQLLT